VKASRSICTRFEEDADFLTCVVDMDETWVHCYDPEITAVDGMEASWFSKTKEISSAKIN
jgi:hypothetical protein